MSPAAWARKPTPTSVSFFSKPAVTPLTMFATSARSVPCIGPASSLAALQTSVSPLFSIDTLSPYVRVSEPSGPLTVIEPAPSVTSTLGGSGMGLLPMRDIVFFLGIRLLHTQATMQSTSPPTPEARALRSVITPCDVETIAMPRPFITRGMSSLPL